MFKAYVFDAYGTLFDVHSAVSRHFANVGKDPEQVSEVWRNKQLEYSWTRTGMDKYLDFWQLTADALDYALEAVPESNADCREELLNAYMSLDCYAEVAGVLRQLKDTGAKTAILSNGSPHMLQSAVNSAGLSDLLDDQFSVDSVGVFKTHPATYEMVTKAYDLEPQEIAFQSSNRWDIAGAAAFGFQCHWINRSAKPDEYKDLSPKKTLIDLNGLI